MAKCDKRKKCDKIKCPGVLDPVCGSDSKTYMNYCFFYQAACKYVCVCVCVVCVVCVYGVRVCVCVLFIFFIIL